MEGLDLDKQHSKIYPRFPTLHGDRVAFVFDDHLWLLQNNIATRLSSGNGQVRAPLFSPDGLRIAFSAYEDDCEEVYCVGVDGSQPTRLTFTGGDCRVVSWSNDGSSIYFDSTWRQDVPCRVSLFSVRSTGGPSRPLPYGKDADHLALQPGGPGKLIGRYCGDPAVTEWKRYQGGKVGTMWIDKTGEGSWVKLAPVPGAGNLGCPVWCADGRIYFISDYEGVGCLYSCNTEGADLQRHTNPTEFYVRQLSTDGHSIVFHSGAQLFVYDTRTAQLTGPLNVQLRGMCMHRQPHSPVPSEHLSSHCLHPEGVALAVCARGQAFAMGLWEGPVLQFNESGNTKHLLACWLSDGNRIVMAQCDSDGEYDLVVHSTDGSQGPKALEIASEELGRPHCIVASPSKKKSTQYVAVVNHRGVLLVVDVLKEDVYVIDEGKHGPTDTAESYTNGFSGISWSACGTWLAYGYKNSSTTSIIKVCDTRSWETHAVTDPVLEDVSPTFDPEGRYLYFISSREFEPQEDRLHFGMSFPHCQRPFVLLLRKDVADPFMPELKPPGFEHESDEDDEDWDSDEDDDDEPQPFEIDFDGIKDRILAFNVDAGTYSSITAYDGNNVLWVSTMPSAGVESDDEEDGVLEKYNFAKRKASTLMEDVFSVELSMDREVLAVMLVDTDDRLRVLSAGSSPDDKDESGDEEEDADDDDEPGRSSGFVDIDGRITLHVDPQQEWEYVLGEAWKSMRDLFHSEAAVEGEFWETCFQRYHKLLPHLACRAELSDLMRELFGELSTSHAFVESPETSTEPDGKPKVPACLGAEFEWDGEKRGWKLTHIVRGDVWDANKGGPLARAGLGVQLGDVLVGLNRRQLSKELSPERALVSVQPESEVLLTFLNQPNPTKKGKQEWVAGTNAKKKKKKKPKEKNAKKNQKDWRSPFCKGSQGPPGTWSRRVRTIECDEVARYRDWVNGRREEVHRASNGRLGYVHIPDMDRLGFAEFHRNYIPESGREALILDVRYNQGGNVSELVLDKLTRRALGTEVGRHVEPQSWPSYAPRGPMVLLVNEETCSDGDIIAKSFQTLKLGTLIGKRTWGGVVGIDGDVESELIDGGDVCYPSANLVFFDEERPIENNGVTPDIEVECSPGEFARGVDSQLRAAIQHLTDQLERPTNASNSSQPAP